MNATAEESDLKRYEDYPSTKPEGLVSFHESTVAPIAYEIPLGSYVLDVGANDGTFMDLLIDKRDCKVVGIDPSLVAVKAAKVKGLDVRLGDATELPFPDGTFDVVSCLETLSHIGDPQKALSEMRRVLKPGGFLVGCLPHKNMESYVWADNRLHRRYYDEPALRDELEKAFPMVYLKILNGAQFAIAWCQSVMAHEPAEMLFKAGGKQTDPWEAGLLSEKPRVWFGYTQLAGTVYYRMLGFAEKMDKQGSVEVSYEKVPWTEIDDKSRHWQEQIAMKVRCGSHCPEGFHMGNRIVMNQLENILRATHVSVWQVVANRGVLAFLRCARDIANGPWYKATGERKAFVTEIDDDVFDIPAHNIASHPYHPNSEMEWIAFEQIKLSDALICSTQFLVDKVSAMFPNKPVYLIPNGIDFDLWDTVEPRTDFPPKEEGQLRIGYTGCSNHRGDLELIREPLSAVLKEFKNVQFVMTPQPDKEGLFTGWPDIPNMGVATSWVPIDQYPAYVKGWNIDIGIAPLRDHNFNRAKSNLRWLEYSAMKVPTVASRVYPFKNSIKDGQDGFICNSAQQWYDAIKALIVDKGRRTEVGQAAYGRVKRDFNMDEIAKRYASTLEAIKCNVQISKMKLDANSAIPITRAG